jgi:hypothetical protein
MKTLSSLLDQAHPEAASVRAGEAFALVTTGFFLGMVLALLLSAWVLHRRATRPKPHRKLMMEMEMEEEAEQELQTGRDWERDADWWKRG